MNRNQRDALLITALAAVSIGVLILIAVGSAQYQADHKAHQTSYGQR